MQTEGPGKGTRKARRYVSRQDYSGQRASFELLFRPYYSRVFAYIYAHIGEEDLTRDLTARTLKRAARRWQEPREVPGPVWLFRLARETLAEPGGRGTEVGGLVKAGSTFAEEVLGVVGERLQALVEQMRRLPLMDQEVLSLMYDAELLPDEIAQVLEISEAEVWKTARRALKTLGKRAR